MTTPLSRAFLAFALIVLSPHLYAREQIKIVGSNSALRFVQPVAEQFARNWDDSTPSMEVTGAGAGFELFCNGVGFQYPDIVAAARPMTPAERTICADQGVTEITEIEFGRDALVLVYGGQTTEIDLRKEQLFAALGAKVISAGIISRNTARRWSDIGPDLPNYHIKVMEPEPNTSASIAFRSVFAERCTNEASSVSRPEWEQVCLALRRDEHVFSALKREDMVIEWLENNDGTYALTDYTTYKQYEGRIRAASIDGVEPSREAIANEQYTFASGLYVYMKNIHAKTIPSLQQFLYELTSERAMAPNGYLFERGLVALDDVGRNKARDEALKFGM